MASRGTLRGFGTRERQRQTSYSTTQPLMLDELSRRQKAVKMARVLEHFLGRDDLGGLLVLDIGCSGGIVADELRRQGATVIGFDIDEPALRQGLLRFGRSLAFTLTDCEQLPLRDHCIDVVICNHVYEHVVDARQLFAELRRVLRGSGVAYLGLGNRLGIMEPHYRLPFLSWLPRRLAHRYIRASGRATHYHEQFATRRGLTRLCEGLCVWDYTLTAMMEPDRFAAGDVVPAGVTKVPPPLLRRVRPLLPTYIWVGTLEPSTPEGSSTAVPPELVPTSGTTAERHSRR